MKAIVLWYLVTVGPGHALQWSPPIPTLEDCRILRTILLNDMAGQCIQIKEIQRN